MLLFSSTNEPDKIIKIDGSGNKRNIKNDVY